MYNLLVALLFKMGIKCENHGGSILLLKLLFQEEELYTLISDAKKERIDKQYYVTTGKDEITKEIAGELLSDAEAFVLESKVIINNLGNEDINEYRKRFAKLIG